MRKLIFLKLTLERLIVLTIFDDLRENNVILINSN